MANNKTGFAYYNIDTDRYQDMRIKRLKKDFGCTGIAVYDYILCEIYRVKGCFIQWDESTAFDVAEYFALKETTVNEIVNYCCSVGLFNKALLSSENILTSPSIQKRFLDMSKRAKRNDAKIPEKAMILPEESKIIPETSGDSSGSLPQSKVKKSKEKKSRVLSDESPRTQEEIVLFQNFENWIQKNTPRVNQLKEPLTIDQYFRLKQKVPKETLTKVLKAMQNRADLLKKYVSAYLTILNWSSREDVPVVEMKPENNVNERLLSKWK